MKKLSEQEQKLLEQKNKRKQQRKIRKEMKERELKRLWEAQSIQRKLNEVDVKMFELEERAKQVEKNLRNGESKSKMFLLYRWSQNDTNIPIVDYIASLKIDYFLLLIF